MTKTNVRGHAKVEKDMSVDGNRSSESIRSPAQPLLEKPSERISLIPARHFACDARAREDANGGRLALFSSGMIEIRRFSSSSKIFS